MSEYDVISNFRTEFSPLVPSKMRFLGNFFIFQTIKLKFGTGIQHWMLILIFGSKVVLGTISDNMTQKPLFYARFWRFFGQTPVRNSVVMATHKAPGDQKLFERVCYMLKLKVTKFQFPTRNGF